MPPFCLLDRLVFCFRSTARDVLVLFQYSNRHNFFIIFKPLRLAMVSTPGIVCFFGKIPGPGNKELIFF